MTARHPMRGSAAGRARRAWSRRLVAWALGLAALVAGLGEASAGVCDGMRLDSGQVHLQNRLVAPGTGNADEAACAQRIGAALVARTRVRSVTVAVRVLAGQREAGEQTARSWSQWLVKAGVPAARVATIVPIVGDAASTGVFVVFREPTLRPVALVHDVRGVVEVGAELDALAVAGKGTRLTSGQIAASGMASNIRLALADGSFVKLTPSSAVRLGRVELNADLKRNVGLELLRGRVEAVVVPQGAGSAFEVATNVAVAGVRGTEFRIALAEGGRTVVETVRGVVELRGRKGARGSVLLRAGEVAWVDESGKPSRVGTLLPEAEIAGPLQGQVRRDVVLRWSKVAAARSYRVEFAEDGEHTLGVRTVDASAPSTTLPPGLPAGAWFWRVLAIDANGSPGRPSKTHRLEVQP